MNFLAYKRHSAFSVSGFTDPSDHFVGDDGAYYLFTDLTTLWQESTRTTQSAATDPVGYADDLSGNGNDALQATSAARFTAQSDGVSLDLVDDLLQITVPAGGWVGTMVVGTDIGCFSADVTIPVGTYNLGGNYFPMLNTSRLIGVEIIDRTLTAGEIDDTIAFFVTEGAAENYSTFTGSMEGFFFGHTELTGTISDFTIGSSATILKNTFRDSDIITFDFTGSDLSGVTTCQRIFQNCPLTSITVAGAFDTCLALDYSSGFSGCALDVNSVNDILVSIEAAGTSSGTISLGGGTSAAPTGAGATAKSDLQGRGWTVTTN